MLDSPLLFLHIYMNLNFEWICPDTNFLVKRRDYAAESIICQLSKFPSVYLSSIHARLTDEWEKMGRTSMGPQWEDVLPK